MAHNKQFTLFTAHRSPFSNTVLFALHELGLTYEPVYLDLQKGEQNSDEYTKYNPNGRVPALVDHKNNDFTVWESYAIVQYLTDKYDPQHKISAAGDDKHAVSQWLFFQASGQGAALYSYFYYVNRHPERVPSVIEHCEADVLRAFGVLEHVLSKQEWLVGDKFTVADAAFAPFSPQGSGGYLELSAFDIEHKFPSVHKWLNAMFSRPAMKEALKLVELSNKAILGADAS